ncbi:MAG: HAMP domain-containing histidine kinase [Saprospiraceae bacterium]|nr:HAMP domain-containing histidine kinase [Saprospiraceae bacterium]
MSNRTIWRIVFFGAISIIGILAFQMYWFLRAWDFKDQEFHQRVHIALINVAREIARFNKSELPSYDLVKKLNSHYYVVNVNDAIDAGALEFYLRKEFEAVSLTTDFEYAIYDCSSDQMVYGNYVSFHNEGSVNPQAGNLPKYDQFLYYFGVRFPGRTTHIMENMPGTLIFSAILLITILFFVYSLSIILRQKRLSELQKDFINNMTHEFKTPISTIRISADVLMKDPLIRKEERLLRYATIIGEQNQRLNHQVEKVLQLARIEKGSLRIHPEPLDLHELLGQVVSGVQVKVQELGGQLRMELNALRTRIQADPLHLSNVIANLLDNAVKYCREVPVITIQTRNIPQGVQLTIHDQGIGIPAADQPRIFGKFYRVSTGNVHDVKGFGLGLYYVRTVCQTHGWDIDLRSEEGQYTAITITIPLS